MEQDGFYGEAVPYNNGYNSYSLGQYVIPFGAIDRAAQLDSQQQAAQNFFPSFFRDIPPLGHSRPYLNPPHEQRNHFQVPRESSFDKSILGSGDFGVIRGGTYYQDNDPPLKSHENDDFYSFYNNGQGRPHAAPYTQKAAGADEQFANFRDFADINTSNDAAFSQYVVVYSNKNSTSEHKNPKNIFEQLELLDKEKKVDKPSKKKYDRLKDPKNTVKSKLIRDIKPRNEFQKRATANEPLLATS